MKTTLTNLKQLDDCLIKMQNFKTLSFLFKSCIGVNFDKLIAKYGFELHDSYKYGELVHKITLKKKEVK
jgi:hypothetical protein